MGEIRVEWRVQRGEFRQSDFIKIQSNSTRTWPSLSPGKRFYKYYYFCHLIMLDHPSSVDFRV